MENSSQPGREEFFNDPMLTRLNDQVLVGNREPKTLAEEVKDEANEPVIELFAHEAEGAPSCDRDRLQLPAGSAVLYPLLRRPAPGPNLPENFDLHQADLKSEPPQVYEATSSDNSSCVKVEEFFNDPMLVNLIHQALAGNRELKILNEEVQIASNEILARQGAYLPFVTAGGGWR